MRLTNLVGKTLRQPPSDAHLTSHQLLVRAGYVRSLEGSLFAYLPLGRRTLGRLETLIRTELIALGAQEYQAALPPDHGPTSAVERLALREIDSYRQLPATLFRFAPLVVPRTGVRAGLFGAGQRPAVWVDGFGAAEPGDAGTGEITGAVEKLFAACEVDTVWAEDTRGRADQGQPGPGRSAYLLHPAGDEELALCPACDYAATRPWAQTRWPAPADEEELPPEEIATPGCDTIASLAEFLDIPAAKTLKMVFYSVDGQVTCVVIRGDRAVDEDKLAELLGTRQYYASLEEELAAVGAVGGYASPIGLDTTRVRVAADYSVHSGKNFVSGANRADYHIQNVNIPRDFAPEAWLDLALIESGDPCPHCGAALVIEPAFAMARASHGPCLPNAGYQAEDGRNRPLWVSSYQVDLGRLLAATVEMHHDNYGILWPAACAPFDVHLVALDRRKEAVAAQADALYERLQAGGLAVLYDDRDASAGVKFNDADLIGAPLRLTVSKRSVKEGLVEAKWRNSRERLKLDEQGLAAELARLQPTT